jgi:hypothetical protein
MILPPIAIGKQNGFESAAAWTVVFFPQYLFIHTWGLPFLVSDKRPTMR